MDNKPKEQVYVYNQNIGNNEMYPLSQQIGYESNHMIPNNTNFNVIINLNGKAITLVSNPLDELSKTTSVKIKQKIEVLELISGCETPNRYHVYTKNLNGGWNYLFKCKELSGFCSRVCLTSDMRPFNMIIKHVSNVNDYQETDFSSNEFVKFKRDCKCTCFCLARPEMIGLKNGDKFGKIKEPFTCCDPVYQIYDKNDNVKYVIRADCCQYGIICRGTICGRCSEVTFQIHEKDKIDLNDKNMDGYFKKVFTSGAQEVFTDANTFILEFPKSANVDDKLLLIGTVLMIDYRMFEDNSGKEY